MVGAYEAMGTGEVDLTWAEEHHSLWLKEQRPPIVRSDVASAPAE
jgi:cytochrome b subunit of formate dehydrogenase